MATDQLGWDVFRMQFVGYSADRLVFTMEEISIAVVRPLRADEVNEVREVNGVNEANAVAGAVVYAGAGAVAFGGRASDLFRGCSVASNRIS